MTGHLPCDRDPPSEVQTKP